MVSINAEQFGCHCDAFYRWYGAVEGVGTQEKILLSLDSSEVFWQHLKS